MSQHHHHDHDVDVDQDQVHKAQTLQTLTTGPLASSLSKLSASSRAVPSGKDFHFFNNFDEFKLPIQEISKKSQSMLETIGSSEARVWGDNKKDMAFPSNTDDMDDAYDWLVNVNDELLERFDTSADEFRGIRKKEEETGLAGAGPDDGFQLVCRKKNNNKKEASRGDSASASAVKVALKDNKTAGPKPKVPFHIPSIRKPQEEFNILVNNSNQPFQHVWLQRCDDDAQTFIHPLEKLSVLDFVDKDIGNVDPVEPPSVESTPFKIVEEVKDLKELAAKLRGVNEFAIHQSLCPPILANEESS
uniref:Exosome-associated factor Rrp6 N-terminal domain-containing protein n=1 Tax=Fagus sylvatica TaxID=28930 RepID=A0A2N9G4B7_FAGSY